MMLDGEEKDRLPRRARRGAGGCRDDRRGAHGRRLRDVLAVRGAGVALVVKQALPRLRVAEEWHAPARRTEPRPRRCVAARLDPGPGPTRGRQRRERARRRAAARAARVAQLAGRAARGARACRLGAWAGDTLGRLHAATAGDRGRAAFGDHEAFELLRLDPYHGT